MMRRGSLTYLALTVILTGCGRDGGNDQAVLSAPPGGSTGATQTYANGHPLVLPTESQAVLDVESDVITLVNDHRVSLGLNALIDTGNIQDVSRAHSRHMIVHSFFDHINPEGDSPGGRLTSAGLPWKESGENIAAGYSTPSDAFNAWMNSPGHKQNIEYPTWSHTGVGYDNDPSSTYQTYWTQNFIKE